MTKRTFHYIQRKSDGRFAVIGMGYRITDWVDTPRMAYGFGTRKAAQMVHTAILKDDHDYQIATAKG